MPKSNSEIRDLVDAFVADLSVLIHQSALESVRDALGGAAPARRGRPPGRRKTAKRKTTRAAKKKSGKRIRRSAADLEAMGAKVLAHVKSRPGQGIEAISKALRMSSKELRRPIQMLVADRKLSTKGQKRGTTYWPGGRAATRSKAAPKRKTGKKRRKKA